MLRKSFLLLFLIQCVTSTSLGFASQEHSVREEITASSENVYRIFPANDKYTYVEFASGWGSGKKTKAFKLSLVEACTSRGKQLEILTTTKGDPITGKTSDVWQAIKVDEKGKYKHPETSFKKKFLADKPLRHYRCKDLFDITESYAEQGISKIFNNTPYQILRAIGIRHNSPQPLLYSNKKMPALNEVVMPPDGDLKTTVPRLKKQLDTYIYLTVLCNKHGGTGRYVIKRNAGGPLSSNGEVSPEEAFKFVRKYENSTQLEYYFECSGNDVNFLVKAKNVVNGPGYFARKNYFASNRNLEDIEYSPLPFANKSNTKSATSTIVNNKPVQDADEKLAAEIANKKTNLFRSKNTTEWVGIYNGLDSNECDLITIEKTLDTTIRPLRTDILNYRVCGGVVAAKVETNSFETATLPEEIYTYALKVAHMARRLGEAQGKYQHYDIKTRALRDKDECQVEIKIFDGIKLMDMRDVNVCN